MVIFVAVKLKKLFKKKRNYSWPKPESCPRCNDYKVWGHGYAQAIFDGYNEPLLLKLYRCPVCGCVIKLRPGVFTFSIFRDGLQGRTLVYKLTG
ncbi:MAG: hypothetical protein ACNYWU_06885, partial [Desulfobacterales bacterium]